MNKWLIMAINTALMCTIVMLLQSGAAVWYTIPFFVALCFTNYIDGYKTSQERYKDIPF